MVPSTLDGVERFRDARAAAEGGTSSAAACTELLALAGSRGLSY